MEQRGDDAPRSPANDGAVDGEIDEDPRAEGARAILVLLDALPELSPVVEDLADDLHEDLSAQVVFAELATITSLLSEADRDDEDEERLERIFAAIETVAGTPGIDTTETVAFSFLDGLSPAAAALAPSYFGPVTEVIAGELAIDALELG
jgi:hypothetical protein